MMVNESKRITVAPGSELDRLLTEASDAPILLERNGVRYRIEAEAPEDLWAGYDAHAVRETVRRTTGRWSNVDADALIANLYRAREAGSRDSSRS